ncbi:MAG TPA: hypothetical protein VFZ83_16255, partial [Acidimicrobiia bacterium]|nr:hypothetical protein [Acidimicrobiia bacterium]
MSLVAVSVPAHAFVRDATGNIVEIAPPASVGLGGICSATQMQVFDEQQGVTLASEMAADFANPGTYTSAPAWASRVRIPAGTVVDSHLLASRKCTSTSTSLREGSIEFASDIVGVMATGGKIVDSDILGAPGTSYPGAIRDRQWELSPAADWLRIDSARELFAHADTTTAVDHMRILTRSNVAPTVGAGGPYIGFEGTPVVLSGSASDPELDPVTIQWAIDSFSGDPGTVCTITNVNTLAPSVECDDDAIVNVSIEGTDGYHPAVSATAQVTISNVDPEITSLTLPGVQVGVGAPVNLGGAFTDDGANDTHGAGSSVSWGDTSTSTP